MPDPSHRKIPVLDDIISTPIDLDEGQTVSMPAIHSAETLLDKKVTEPVLKPVDELTEGEDQNIDIHALSETIFEQRIEPVIDRTTPATEDELPQISNSEQEIDTEVMARQIVQTLLPDLEQQLNELVQSALENRLKNKQS